MSDHDKRQIGLKTEYCSHIWNGVLPNLQQTGFYPVPPLRGNVSQGQVSFGETERAHTSQMVKIYPTPRKKKFAHIVNFFRNRVSVRRQRTDWVVHFPITENLKIASQTAGSLTPTGWDEVWRRFKFSVGPYIRAKDQNLPYSGAL